MNIAPARSLIWALALAMASTGAARSQESAGVAEVRAAGEQFAQAFQRGKAAEVAALFAPQGELVDEEGTIYKGTQEITSLLTQYFERFPKANLEVTPEAIRLVGDSLALEDGVRVITAGKESTARLRYEAVWSKSKEGRWLLASIREFADDPPPTPHDRLQPLAWLVGDWVNEGSDSVVKMSYRWSEEGNFLLGSFEFTTAGKSTLKSTHRIGWDPLAGKVRSWLFDADGGFSEGQWTQIDDTWVIKSSSVNPDGTSGNATITYTPNGKDAFSVKGTERIVGDAREPDFDFKIVRQPPAASR
jgi:uncharacterized protein (TIGR02246 family)